MENSNAFIKTLNTQTLTTLKTLQILIQNTITKELNIEVVI
jgi:hypothetical protein